MKNPTTPTTRGFFLMLLTGALCLMLVGCRGDDSQKTAPLTKADQIRRIQNDPKMPQAAKEVAIQQLQQQGGSPGVPPVAAQAK